MLPCATEAFYASSTIAPLSIFNKHIGNTTAKEAFKCTRPKRLDLQMISNPHMWYGDRYSSRRVLFPQWMATRPLAFWYRGRYVRECVSRSIINALVPIGGSTQIVCLGMA